MAVFMVTYDLHAPNKNYPAVIAKITGYNDHKKALLSAYLVNTGHTAQQIFDHIKPALDNNDNLIVIQVSNDYQGWMPKDVWDWLNARM